MSSGSGSDGRCEHPVRSERAGRSTTTSRRARGTSCKTYRLRNEENETRGLTQVYYSTSLGGVVCAMTLDSSRGSHGMTVTVKKGSLRATGSDRGIYAHYAGGIADPRAKGRCFTITGSVNYGSNRTLQFSGGGSFCNPQRS